MKTTTRSSIQVTAAALMLAALAFSAADMDVKRPTMRVGR